ncbi:CoA transferase [Solirubrobacter ginsenosidimutans]|uniref:CoA transferase n=1 Tax=Solirubrobacter ginsenosidimutans TaxID=490573 RepID=A0A9X3MN96_9ACTN|nr:CoA transferase [Solirubrobacter ginsenosidimutans]MDA0159250.1 CoA transferase [Solirubrobacter ginsenosidimutans]
MAEQPRGPLTGVRVLDIATMLAAGHMTSLMADFGADVIHVELPGRGDSLRQMGPFKDGRSLRWAVVGRGKRSITADLHDERDQQRIRELASTADVVVENFRPGTVSRWGLDYERLSEANPGLIMVSITGYGQTGPKRHMPGFGRVLEAVSGLMNSTGDPNGPPTQIGVPLVDYIAGMNAAMATSMALVHRDKSGDGQQIDVSLYETMIRLLDALITRYGATGDVPTRAGNRYVNVAPSDVYRTRDDRYVFHSSATQTVFVRLAKAIGREDLLDDPRFATNAARTQRVDEVNDIVQAWFDRHDFDDVVSIMAANDVPIGPVNTMKEVAADEHLRERESLLELGGVLMPGVIPKFSLTPGAIRHAGPELGEHDEAVLSWLGIEVS